MEDFEKINQEITATINRRHLQQKAAAERLAYVREKDGRLIFDPKSLTFDDACLLMWATSDSLDVGSGARPKIIDFEELAKAKCPEKGYYFHQPGRDIRIRISTYAYEGYRHYYAALKFYGLAIVPEGKKYGYCQFGKSYEHIDSPLVRPLGDCREEVYRFVVKDDFADKYSDWSEGVDVGSRTHRFYSEQNAEDFARRIVELLFRNYGEITVERLGCY